MTIEIRANSAAHEASPPPRDWQVAVRRGLAHRCPACGEKSLYTSYLKVADTCPSCAEELHHHRADDAPPYFTIFIVGHIVVALVMYVEKTYAPELWVHTLLWVPLILGLSLVLLPRIKGALVGLQWSLRMHGFAGPDPEDTLAVHPPELSGR